MEYILTPDEYEELKRALVEINKSYLETVKAGYSSASEQDGHHDEGFQLSKRESGILLSRLEEVKSVLQNARVVVPKEQNECVRLGNGVEIEYQDYNTKYQFIICGFVGSNTNTDRKVSTQSPLGKALLGKKMGDVFLVQLPTKKVIVQIKRILPPSRAQEIFLKGLQ